MHPAPAPLPTAITSRRGEPPTRTSFLVVGTGWRAEPYLRLAAMLPDRFRVTARGGADIYGLDELRWRSPKVDRASSTNVGGEGASGRTNARAMSSRALRTSRRCAATVSS